MVKKLVSPIISFSSFLLYLLLIKTQHNLSAVILVIVGFAYLLPILSVLYSKIFLRKSSHRFLYTLYHSFVLALSYLVFCLIQGRSYDYALYIFVFSEIWAIAGLIRVSDQGKWGNAFNKFLFPFVGFILTLIGQLLIYLKINGYVSYGVLLIGFFHLIPVLSVSYSKMILRDVSHKLRYTFYHSFIIALSLLVFLPMHIIGYIYALSLFVWCEIWALFGMIKKTNTIKTRTNCNCQSKI